MYNQDFTESDELPHPVPCCSRTGICQVQLEVEVDGGLNENEISQQLRSEDGRQNPPQTDTLRDEASTDSQQNYHLFFTDIHAALRELTATVTEQKVNIRELTATVTEQKVNIRELTATVTEQKANIKELTTTVTEQKANNRELTATVTEQKTINRELTATVTEQKTINRELTATVTEQKTINRELTANIRALETLLREQQTFILEEMNKKNDEISNLTLSQVEELRKENRDREIAFSASLMKSGRDYIGPFTTEITLTYRNVITNIGNAYNPVTGIFTAPLKGAYMFRVSVYGRGPTAATAAIFKNGEHVVIAHDYQVQSKDEDGFNSSNGVVLILEVGDVVYKGMNGRDFALEFSSAAEGLGLGEMSLKDLFNYALEEPVDVWTTAGLEHLTFWRFVAFLDRRKSPPVRQVAAFPGGPEKPAASLVGPEEAAVLPGGPKRRSPCRRHPSVSHCRRPPQLLALSAPTMLPIKPVSLHIRSAEPETVHVTSAEPETVHVTSAEPVSPDKMAAVEPLSVPEPGSVPALVSVPVPWPPEGSSPPWPPEGSSPPWSPALPAPPWPLAKTAPPRPPAQLAPPWLSARTPDLPELPWSIPSAPSWFSARSPDPPERPWRNPPVPPWSTRTFWPARRVLTGLATLPHLPVLVF
ncbi:unnamed protein product [Leuciscus chuanchicus]